MKTTFCLKTPMLAIFLSMNAWWKLALQWKSGFWLIWLSMNEANASLHLVEEIMISFKMNVVKVSDWTEYIFTRENLSWNIWLSDKRLWKPIFCILESSLHPSNMEYRREFWDSVLQNTFYVLTSSQESKVLCLLTTSWLSFFWLCFWVQLDWAC